MFCDCRGLIFYIKCKIFTLSTSRHWEGICGAGSLFEPWSWGPGAIASSPVSQQFQFFVPSLKKLMVRGRGSVTVLAARVWSWTAARAIKGAKRGDGCVRRRIGSVLFFIHAQVFFPNEMSFTSSVSVRLASHSCSTKSSFISWLKPSRI
jgi:hypothetical protein